MNFIESWEDLPITKEDSNFMFSKDIQYLKFIIKHKYFVTRECFKMGLYWRGLVHDLSKFLPKEWIAYRNYFYGTYKPYEQFSSGLKYEFDCFKISKEYIEQQLDYAWLNHQHKNKHHWQYWVLRQDSGVTIALEMPDVYIKEMVCDWIGAGLAITGKREFKQWYADNKNKMKLHKNTRDKVESLLNKIN
jgi:hypothetical protein